jgi:hypothetical protein
VLRQELISREPDNHAKTEPTPDLPKKTEQNKKKKKERKGKRKNRPKMTGRKRIEIQEVAEIAKQLLISSACVLL